MQWMSRWFAVSSLLLIASAGTPALAADGTLLGVYYGNEGWKMTEVQHLESWQAKKNATVLLFTNWCDQRKPQDNLFNLQLPAIWNNGNVPLITWEPFLCTSTNTPADVEVRAARGEYDAYLSAWATRLKTFLSGKDGLYGTADDRRAYLRLGHEMNGDWYPWSAAVGANSPADYVAMWRRVRDLFAAKGLDGTRLQWIWCVNHDDVGGYTAESFYPGDAYVDWVAIDGYNWGTSQSWSTWKSPDAVYGPMISRLRSLTVAPLAVTEFATTSAGAGISGKAQWTADAINYLAGQFVKMIVWFNYDKETDWAVFGGAAGDSTFKVGRTTYKAYSTYRQAVSSPALVGSDASNPRLMTDLQFTGK